MGSEVVPYAPQPPEPRGTRNLSFSVVAFQMAALTGDAFSLKEKLHMLKRRTEADAAGTDRIAEMCVEAEVEPQFVAEMHQAAAALRGVAEAAAGVAGAADDMSARAKGFTDAHQREYRGVYEQAQADDHQQAKPGFYRDRRG